jgi:hypothetical protein
MTNFIDTAVSYGELRAALKDVFPDLNDDELNAAMFALWARVLLKRVGIKL